MQERVPRSNATTTTQAAEGLPRRRWTTAELERAVASGIIDPDERIELIGGEVVPMSPRGRRHEIVRDRLSKALMRLETPDAWVCCEPQLNLDADSYSVPDIVVRSAAIEMPDVRGATALLVIEIADSSPAYDTTTKAAIYATQGVREYWVINAWTLATKVHREPSSGGYSNIAEAAPSERLEPLLTSALAIRLSELGIE